MKTLYNIAKHEFKDHLSSKYFIILFSVFIILSISGIVSGLNNYNQQIRDYNEQIDQNIVSPDYQEEVAALQMQLKKAEDEGASADQIKTLRYNLNMLTQPPMPSALIIFESFNSNFGLIGIILAISMGFNTITREKEDGTFKALLSHPIHRDTILIGKMLGAILILSMIISSCFIIIISILLLNGVMPSFDELIRIVIYMCSILILLLLFYNISLVTSSISKNSTTSLFNSFFIIVVMILTPTILISIDSISSQDDQQIIINNNGKMQYINSPNVQQLIDIISFIYPTDNFEKISSSIVKKQVTTSIPISSNSAYTIGDNSIPGSIIKVLSNYIVLMFEIVILFTISYISFMRMDII